MFLIFRSNRVREARRRVQKFTANLSQSDSDALDSILGTLVDFDLDLRGDFNDTGPTEEECFQWNLYNSIFFSFTAVTTIGKIINLHLFKPTL